MHKYFVGSSCLSCENFKAIKLKFTNKTWQHEMQAVCDKQTLKRNKNKKPAISNFRVGNSWAAQRTNKKARKGKLH